MKILIATHNPGKFNELSRFLFQHKIDTVSLDDLNIKKDVEETGSTFYENALLKAKAYCELSNLPSMADDGGIEIDALNGEPGVKSRRWKGYEMTDQELLDYTLERLAGIPQEKRTAHLATTLILAFPDGKTVDANASIDGYVTEKPLCPIIPGYPFRSIFFVPQFNKVLAQLTDEEHGQINHRLKALQKLIDKMDKKDSR